MDLIEKYFLWICTFMVSVLYILVPGFFYLILYRWKGNPFAGRKIQEVNISSTQYRREAGLTISSLIIFCITGYFVGLMYQDGRTLIYFKISSYGMIYFLTSILCMIFLHDTYFYWTHRLLHRPGWYESIHIIHHQSSSPTPWTALAFHPAEAFIQAAILPLIILIMPTHPQAIFIFSIYMVLMNVLGHSGYELYTNKNLNRWKSSTRDHDMHHKYAKDNYGLYFTFWDKWMRTGRK